MRPNRTDTTGRPIDTRSSRLTLVALATLVFCAAGPATAPTPPTGPVPVPPAAPPIVTTQPVTTQPIRPPATNAVPHPDIPVTPTPATQKAPASQPALTPIAPPPPPLGPMDEREAYARGFEAGRVLRVKLKEDPRLANEGTIISAFVAGLHGEDPKYSRQELEAVFAKAQLDRQQREAQGRYADDPAFRKLADDNQKRSTELLEQNARTAGVDVRPDGVQVQTLVPGTGRRMGNAKTITLALRVMLVDGTLIKTSETNKPIKVASADVLPALINACRTMKTGGKWCVVLPPDKAYGLAGKPSIIGPNEALRYEIELVSVD